MPKTKRAPSKRMSSNQRHKVERKKREHKRDLNKAAKAMKAAGLGPKRSKKSRETARLALKISNIHPDKEAILTKVLQAREAARVSRATDKKEAKDEEDSQQVMDAQDLANMKRQSGSSKKALLYIPTSQSNQFTFQFNKSLEEMVFPIRTASQADEVNPEMPTSAYVVTVDSRCAVQSAPWTLVDAIVARGAEYARAHMTETGASAKKRGRDEAAATRKKQVLILFALTKCDLVSAQTISTQFALIATAIQERYFAGEKKPHQKSFSAHSLELPGGIVFSFAPVSTEFEKCQKQLLKVLRRFHASCGAEAPATKTSVHNMTAKVCTFVIGLPNTGRRTLARSLLTTGSDSAVAVVPLRAAQVQLVKTETEGEVLVRFVLPNSKSVTIVQFPEDSRLRSEANEALAAGDVLFQSYSAVEKMQEPEAVAIMLAQGVTDPRQLAQAFCQPTYQLSSSDEETVKSVAHFLKGIGNTVRREGGFHISPLFVSNSGSAGQLAATSLTASSGFTSKDESNRLTLLDSSFSNARPSKLVRISNISIGKGKTGRKDSAVKKIDGRNALRIGARTFLREFSQGKHVPWAILRAEKVLTPASVAESSRVLSLALFGRQETIEKTFASASEYLQAYLDDLTHLLKDVLVLLPNGVVEFRPDSIVPVLHSLEEEAVSESDEEPEEDEEEEDAEEGDDEENDEEGDEEEDDEKSNDEEEEGDFEESDDDEE